MTRHIGTVRRAVAALRGWLDRRRPLYGWLDEAARFTSPAHTVVGQVDGTPIVRLEKDWAEMTAAERDALLEAVTERDGGA